MIRLLDTLGGGDTITATGTDLLTDKQKGRLDALFADDDHVQVEVTWAAYQRMIAAYRHPDPTQGRQLMQAVTPS